ncbi:MAG: hypothetical protein ACFFDJ_03070 [Candidatus Odinarchaeota archaeon]
MVISKDEFSEEEKEILNHRLKRMKQRFELIEETFESPAFTKQLQRTLDPETKEKIEEAIEEEE